MNLLILYVSLALGVSFLCSVLEAVLLSITPSYLATTAESNPAVSKVLSGFKADIDRPLAAILSLNTVAHTIGAAGAGAQALEVFGSAYLSAFSAVLTLAILFLSEIIPKTLGAVYWKGLAPWVARAMPPLIILTYPLVLMSQALAKLVAKKEHGPTLNREEFSALAAQVASEGVFDKNESTVMKNLLRFRQLKAEDIMTPRTVMSAFEENTTVADVAADEESLHFSRWPIYSGKLDEVSGYVLKQDILLEIVQGRPETKLSDLKRKLSVMPADTPLAQLLDKILEIKEHLVVLTGSFGGVAGLVTLEDVVETLIGMEIVDEMDKVEDMQALARRTWRERAKRRGLHLEDLDAESPETGAETPSSPS